ncbi:MAG: hypothetical protein ACLRNW_03795 [Neglectibacter sp.]
MTAVLEAIGMEKRFPVKQQMLLRRRDTFQALQGSIWHCTQDRLWAW